MILDPRLRDSSFFIIDLSLCQVRLSNNAAFPWIILIPRVEEIQEISDLNEVDQQKLMREITQVSKAMQTLFNPHKLNVASLGNVVPQLHIHIIARMKSDPAWPNPVWNTVTAEYDPEARNQRIMALEEALFL